MYIYNKFCVHLRNAANGFLSSARPDDIFVIVAAVRLFPSITVSLPPTAEPSPVTADLIARRPSERRPSDPNEPRKCGRGGARRRRADKDRTERKQ